jgi:hypothetical protein
MPDSESGPQNRTRTRRRRADTVLVFNPSQKVPHSVLDAIIDGWLVPCLVEQFLRERGVTRQSLLAHYRALE